MVLKLIIELFMHERYDLVAKISKADNLCFSSILKNSILDVEAVKCLLYNLHSYVIYHKFMKGCDYLGKR